MIDLFAVMEKKREHERHETRLEKQKRHEEKIDQTKNLIEILIMAVTQTKVKSHKENHDSAEILKRTKKNKKKLKENKDYRPHLSHKQSGNKSSASNTTDEETGDSTDQNEMLYKIDLVSRTFIPALSSSWFSCKSICVIKNTWCPT